jgi:alkylation response protein AidB-like acyl-CoA dehydrogenase
MRRRLYEAEHEAFRESFRKFVDIEMVPHLAEWEKVGIVPRELFAAAGKSGFLGTDVPEEYGGGGVRDYRFNAVVNEEIMRAGTFGAGAGFTVQNDLCVPYLLAFASEEQKRRWLPGIVSGELIGALAMTEPGAGSDLASMTTSARREGDHYVVNGSKIFISNGINADIVITAVKTDPTQRHRGMSLLVLERGAEGLQRGRNLDKLGMHAQDTAELFFTDLRVPVANLLGEAEGNGFTQLIHNLPQERLSIAVSAVAAAQAALDQTLEFVKGRRAFGTPVGSFQNSRFVLAEIATEVDIAQRYVDDCVLALNDGDLTAVDAAKAKWWTSELQGRVVDRCLQLHGGYGYMSEYGISRAYTDARITRIYGGTTEIMKEVIGRDLGL